MTRSIDQLDRARRRTLIGFLVAFVAWQSPTILQEVAGARLPGPAITALSLVAAAAGLLWVYSALRLFALRRRIASDPVTASALDDERIREVRAKALAFAFWCVVVYLTALRLVAFTAEIATGGAALGGLLVAGVAAIGAFLVLDRE